MTDDQKAADPQPIRKKPGNFIQRLLLFIVAVPAIIGIIFLEPSRWHWPLNLVILSIAAPSAFEASRLFGMNPMKRQTRALGIIFNSLVMPIMAFLWVMEIIGTDLMFPVFTMQVMAVLFVQVFRQQYKVKKISPGIGKHLAVLAYPSLLLAHLVMISKLPNASVLYLAFIAIVFGNDTMAYVGGRLFGKKGDNPIPISPNKTTAGFVTGYLFSTVGILIVYAIFPNAFPGGIPAVIALGMITGFTTIVGDLIESGLKRSAKKKDSGEVIPGRGGLLDSIDSILYTAPVFFYGYQILNGTWIM